jgi:hypothetical protein
MTRKAGRNSGPSGEAPHDAPIKTIEDGLE